MSDETKPRRQSVEIAFGDDSGNNSNAILLDSDGDIWIKDGTGDNTSSVYIHRSLLPEFVRTLAELLK